MLFLSTFCIHLCPKTKKVQSDFTFTLWTEILSRKCLCLILHVAYSAGAQASHKNPCVISLHGGSLSALSSYTEKVQKPFFSLHWWNGYSSALNSKKKEFIFSVHPYSNLLSNIFFYWFGRADVCDCIYKCTCVKEQNEFFVC